MMMIIVIMMIMLMIMINDGNNMVMINYIVMIINDIQMNNDYGDYQMIMVMTNDQVMMIMV